MTRTAKSVHPRLVFGSVLVVIGFLFLFDHLLPYRFHFRSFWPLILVIWGLARFSAYGARRWVFSSGLIIVGVIYLLDDYFPFSYIFDWDNIWPLAIIAFGGYLITRNLNQRRSNENISDPEASGSGAFDELKAVTILGGRNSFITSSNFSGGDVTVALGGLKIDCLQAKLSNQAPEVTIDVTVIMGGVEVIVPEDWSVVVRATPFLGAVEDKRIQKQSAVSPGTVLVIDGIVLLGGVEIRSHP